MSFFEEDYCLICHNPIKPLEGWRALLSPGKKQELCADCLGKLEMIQGDICQGCYRPFQLLAEQYRIGDICNDCARWEEDADWKDTLDRNRSLFLYNPFLKEVMAKFKFRGDYVISKAFREYIKKAVEQSAADIIVPIPLSAERLYERGFNQASALLIEAGFNVTETILSRVHSEKQSKKSRTARIHIGQVFQLEASPDELSGKKILLVDDIYTTGSTLRHAAKLLKKAGAAAVESLTLAR